MMKLISIIVPSYNQAQYLDECLQSVLDQTYQNWECIIVNDGSPDHTEEVAKNWLEKDERFKYYKQKNNGVSSSRNTGIRIAKGEWILPLDADDKIGNRYLELAEEEFNNYSLVYCKVNLFGIIEKELSVRDYKYHELLFFNPFFCSCFFNKKHWDAVGGYDESMKNGLEDWEFWINMFYNQTITVKKLDYTGFFYRRKNNSTDANINNHEELKDSVKKYIVSKHSIHYAKTIDFVNELFNDKKRLENYLNKYDQLFSRSFLGKLLYAIANKLKKNGRN